MVSGVLQIYLNLSLSFSQMFSVSFVVLVAGNQAVLFFRAGLKCLGIWIFVCCWGILFSSV